MGGIARRPTQDKKPKAPLARQRGPAANGLTGTFASIAFNSTGINVAPKLSYDGQNAFITLAQALVPTLPAGSAGNAVNETLALNLRLEAFNVLNHPNFATPGSSGYIGQSTSLVSSTFGQVTATTNNYGARVFQGALKVTF